MEEKVEKKIEPKSEEEIKALKELGLKYFVFKANVPMDDHEAMLDWTLSCQAHAPQGFGDYRWGKVLHDHMFVKNFKKEMLEIKEKQDTILKLLGNIVKTLATKEIKDEHLDLFSK